MIIGFCGPIGAGKTTAATHLVERWGFARIRFADPLKQMLLTLGLSAAEVDGNLKDKPSSLLCGKTPRQAMQWLGTEFGRDLIGPDLWVNAWRASTCAHLNVVADDVRFPNEVAAIHRAHGKVIRVVRPGQEAGSDHVSEQHTLEADAAVNNDGDIVALAAHVDDVMKRLFGVQRFPAA